MVMRNIPAGKEMPQRWMRSAGKMMPSRMGRRGLLGLALGGLAGTGIGLATPKHTEGYNE